MSESNCRVTSRIGLFVLSVGALALVCGCAASGSGEAGSDSAQNADAVDSRPAGTLPIPGSAASPPAGHPPVSGLAKRLIWDVPKAWRVETPSSTMRIAQYAVDGPGGSAECVVFYFGPSQGGDPMANAQRWAGQFSQPDGSSSLDAMRISRVDGAAVEVQLVEVSGTYDGGMTMTSAPAQPQPGSMLLGGIAEGPDAPWFFKFTGPQETVSAERDAFLGLLTSIRPEG